MTFLPDVKWCSIGTSLNEKCKGTIEDLNDTSDFDDEKGKSLMLHCGLENISSICDYHEQVHFEKFLVSTESTVVILSTSKTKEWKVCLYNFFDSTKLKIVWKKITFLYDRFQLYYDLFQVNWLVQNLWHL